MAQTIRIELPKEGSEKGDPLLNKLGESLRKISRFSEKAQYSINRLDKEVSLFDKACEKMQKRLTNLANREYKIILNMLDHVAPVLDELENKLFSISSKDWNVKIKTQPLKLDTSQINIGIGKIGGNLGASFTQNSSFSVSNIKMQNPVEAPAEKKSVMGAIESVGTVLDVLNGGFELGDNLSKLKKFVTPVIGSASAGTGLLGFGGKAARYLGSGILSNGASLSAGALSAVGLGSVAGGAIGAGVAVSGAIDLYKGYTSKDKVEAAAYKGSGERKIEGVVMGAAAGAAIGSVIPVIGTAAGALIGAGIGGIAGWIDGERVKKDYEEAVKASALAEEQATYESQDLKDALEDATMTAEEFGQKFQKAVGEQLKGKFGDIKLSLKEVQDMAKKIVYDDQVKSVTKFSDAVLSVNNAFAKLENSSGIVDKLNWKASLGLEFSDTEVGEYKTAIDNMTEDAKSYIESKHYEATMAIDLIIGKGASESMTTGLNEMYAGLLKQVEGLGGELRANVKVALEDGVITLDEQKEIERLQSSISAITQKLSDAQTDATFQALSIKFSGADLDSDSFAQLQAEIQEQVLLLNESYDEALEIGITNLNLMLAEGAISQDKYTEMLNELTAGYEGKIEGLRVRVESFQLETIAEAFSKDLEGILPEIEGSTAEKLSTALHNAIANGVDPTVWDTATASKWLGLESLSQETQNNIASLMSEFAKTLPESDFSALSTWIDSGVGAAIENTDMEYIYFAIDGLKANTGTAINNAYAAGFNTTTTVTITPNYKLANPSNTISFSGGGGSRQVMVPYAEGGLLSTPHLGLVAEDGPEAIIPLGNKRRSRGISLWEKAGEMLGITKNKTGGISDQAGYSPSPFSNMDTSKEVSLSIGDSKKSSDIKIEVQMNPQFDVSGSNNEEGIMEVIKKNLKELADDVSGEIAVKLEKVFSNMPVVKET